MSPIDHILCSCLSMDTRLSCLGDTSCDLKNYFSIDNVASGFLMLGGVISSRYEQFRISGRNRRFEMFRNSSVPLKRTSCFEPRC